MNKIVLLFAIIVSVLGCKSKDTTPNRPPNTFAVTPTLKSDGKTITLNWTKAKDPDGDIVTYLVVLKDTLAKNISDTTFTISTLDYNYNQTGKVIAKDNKGLTTEASFSAVTKTQTFVNIPDAIFEKYLVDNKIDKDGTVNGKMEIADAKGISKIDLSHINVKSLLGIEAFIDLKELYCYHSFDSFGDNYPKLTKLDVSKNVALQVLNCHDNFLTSLDVGKNVALQDLFCNDNRLTNLDVSKNVNMRGLACYDNFLTSLDVSKNVALQFLYCFSN